MGATAVEFGFSEGVPVEERLGSGLDSGIVKPSCVDGES